jgi:peptidoglycan/LPS O-acetylase OafA/YrhL
MYGVLDAGALASVGVQDTGKGQPMKTQNTERLHALDAIRGGALLLGVIGHMSMSFWPIPFWPIRDTDPSSFLLSSFGVIHIFRMSLFFVVAGFFARLLLEKRGARGFVADRAKRIGIPLVVGWPLLFAAFIAVIIWSAVRAGTWEAMQAQPQPALSLATIPLLHTWFLYVLLWLYAAALAVVGLVRLVDPKGRIAGAADGFVRAIVKSQLAPIVLGLPLFAVFAFGESWIPWGGIRTPDVGLVPNLSACVAFATAFAFGWLLHRQIDLLSVWRRWWPLYLAAAVALSVVCSAYSELAATPAAIAEMGLMDRLWSSAAYPLATWTWSLGLIGLATACLTKENRTIRYLADSSYWVYLIHLPVAMVFQVLFATVVWPWFVKFPLMLAIAMALMLLSYQLLVRNTSIGAVLNGKRIPGKTRALRAESSSAAATAKNVSAVSLESP